MFPVVCLVDVVRQLKFVITYPTWQNYLLELIFAKFDTAKKREKIRLTKIYFQQVLVALNQSKICYYWAPLALWTGWKKYLAGLDCEFLCFVL